MDLTVLGLQRDLVVVSFCPSEIFLAAKSLLGR
ncbi:uncharacterized, partial [Tachysurus ichikawai]